MITILEKKIVDFEKIIPYERLQPKEIIFLEEIIKPSIHEIGFNQKEQEIILNRYRAIVENRDKYISSLPIKEYDRELIDVEGVRKIGDPNEMARKLVLGLISRKLEIIKSSHEFYQPELLNKIRENINPRRIFKQVEQDLKDEPTTEKTNRLLKTITNSEYSNHNLLNNIADFILTGVKDHKILNQKKSLITRTNERTIDLSISHSRYGCCAFWGIVEKELSYRKDLDSRYHASTLYLADPEIGIIFHHVENNGDADIPAGAIITVDMIGRNTGNGVKLEKVLLVDSIEAYRPDWDTKRFPNNPLREMKNDIWRRLTYNSIFQAAKDIGASKIVYNENFWNEGGNTFTNYLYTRMKEENIEFHRNQLFHLKKEGGKKFLPKYFEYDFGYFIDCIIPHDYEHYSGAHATKGNWNCEGQAKVTAINLK